MEPMASTRAAAPETLSDADTGVQRRALLVVILALTSGATDAIGFLALGNAFTSVMTGNLVLLGVGAADRDAAAVVLVVVAIVSFMVGAAIGAHVVGVAREGDPIWPRAVSVALAIELVMFAAFGVGWWLLDSEPAGDWLIPLLALNAGALGLQSSAIQRFGVPGLSTTYLTGTLTTVVIRLTHGKGLRAVRHSLVILAGLIVGAAVATVALELAPVAVPLLQVGTVAAVLLVALFSRAMRRPA